MREFWFQVHQWVGLGTLAFLIVVALTGSVLTFRSVLDGWLNPELYRASSLPALAPETLVSRAEAARPLARVSLLETRIEPGLAVMLSVVARDPSRPLGYDQLFVDPGTGAVVGKRDLRAGWDRAHILEGVYEMHARLLGGAPGRWLLGGISGMWAISNLIGLYLTLPRGKPFWSRWKPVWTIKFGARLPRLMLDLHRASGLWLLIGVTALAVTGFAMNFFGEIATPVAQALSPARFQDPPEHSAPVVATIDYGQALGLASVAARRDDPALRPAVASYDAEEGAYRMGFTRSGRRDYWWLGPSYYYIDGRDGRVLAHDDPYHDSLGRKFLRGLYPLHSGRMFGWFGRIVVFLLGFVIVEQCVTGAWVWWRKQKAKALSKG